MPPDISTFQVKVCPIVFKFAVTVCPKISTLFFLTLIFQVLLVKVSIAWNTIVALKVSPVFKGCVLFHVKRDPPPEIVKPEARVLEKVSKWE